jgi:Cutinase/LGFP repeat
MRKALKLKASVATFAMTFSLVTMSALQAAQPAAADSPCPATVLIGVHGTNEETGVIGQELSALYNDVKGRTGLPEQGLTDWQDDQSLITDLIGALPQGQAQLDAVASKLQSALNAGVTDLYTQIEGERNSCPGEHFIVAGFSQGAMVVHEFAIDYPALAGVVSGIILWADPVFDGSDWPSYGASDGGSSLTSSSGWHGIFGSFPMPAAWSGRVASYCISDDPICNFNINAEATMAEEFAVQNHGHENLTPAITTASDALIDSAGVGWAPSVYDDGAATFYTTWQNDGGVGGFLGEPGADPVGKPGGGLIQTFAGSSCGSSSGSAILWTPSTATHTMSGCIYNAFTTKYGGPGGTYGYPTTDEDATTNGTGRVNYMAGTSCGSTETGSGLFWSSATGTWPVFGCIYQEYKSIGEDKSGIGLPTSGENSVTGGVEQNFSNGSITDLGGKMTVTIKSGSALDNTDPYESGCVSSAYPKAIVLQATDGPTVIDLEWSAHCGTNWTQVTPNTGTGNGAIEMLIWVERKNASGSITVGDNFEFPPDGSTIGWSDQLYAPTQPARACEEYWVRATKTWSTTVCTAWSAAT